MHKEIIVVVPTPSGVLLTPKTKNWFSPRKGESYKKGQEIIKANGYGLSLKEKRQEVASALFKACLGIEMISFGNKGMEIIADSIKWDSIQSFVHDEIHHEFGACQFEIPRKK
jgi:hypothetical protein